MSSHALHLGPRGCLHSIDSSLGRPLRMVRLLVTLMALLPVSCDWIESNESHYPDMKAAAEAGAILRGWIPAFVPESAVDIRLKYDIENNRTWLSFHGIVDRSTISHACQGLTTIDVTYPSSGPRGWWPDVLTLSSKEGKSEYEYYTCKDGEILAIHRVKAQVFLWRLSK